MRRIEAVLAVLPEGCDLAVDANGRFDLDQALAYADALSAYPLHWYEEAGDPLDYEALRRLAERYEGPLATGENLLSFHEARNLIRYGGLRPDRDILQMDPALSYGLTEFRRTVAMLFDSGWNPDRCVPHGGHQFNLAIASAYHLHGCESYPGIFEPFGGFADGYPDRGRLRRLPDAPGIGLEQKASLAPVLKAVLALAARSPSSSSSNTTSRLRRTVGSTAMTNTTTARISSVRESGRVTKTVGSPREMIRDRRRYSSSSGPEDEAQQQRRRLAAQLDQEVAEDAEEGDRVDVERVEAQRIGPDRREADDRREQHPVGDGQHLHPQADEGKVQQHQEQVADPHRDDEPPDQLRLVGDDVRARRDALDDEARRPAAP